MWMWQLKDKVITEYNKFISGLEKGYKNDYKNILDMICLIEFASYIDNNESLYEYYINL